MEEQVKQPSFVEFPLAEALKCITRYAERVVDHTDMNFVQLVHAYTVKSTDAFAALGVKEPYPSAVYESFRAYLGIGHTVEKENGEEKIVEEYKLFLVPVDKDGLDFIPKKPDGTQYVYDFNTPCPNTCDYKSPLYKAGIVLKK